MTFIWQLPIDLVYLIMEKKYTKDFLDPIIANSDSWWKVCQLSNIRPTAQARTKMRKRAVELKIPFGHFILTVGSNEQKGSVEELKKHLTVNSRLSSYKLKKRLVRLNLIENKCNSCDITHWLGEEAILELDHINSDPMDNRIENLQILCPNCHAHKTKRVRGRGNQQ